MSEKSSQRIKAFQHGLMVGMNLGHGANVPLVMQLYRRGLLPRTAKNLMRLDWALYQFVAKRDAETKAKRR